MSVEKRFRIGERREIYELVRGGRERMSDRVKFEASKDCKWQFLRTIRLVDGDVA